jgi:zinc transport system substrate-binding protein
MVFNIILKKSLFIATVWLYAAVGITQPVVVSSIKPLQMLVDAIAVPTVESQLLLPATVSPHLFQLRPSDRQRLASADLVVWVGPQLEYFLSSTLAQAPAERSLPLYTLEGLSYVDDPHSHTHGSDRQNNDPHLWLNPNNAIIIAQAIAERLAVIDPTNAAAYRRNLQTFRREIEQLDKNIALKFADLPRANYIVLHDAYGHFTRRYGVPPAAVIMPNPDRPIGARHRLTLEKVLAAQSIDCLFLEPQLQSPIVDTLLDSDTITIAELDPLAVSIASSPEAYKDFMRAFSQAFYDCVVQGRIIPTTTHEN